MTNIDDINGESELQFQLAKEHEGSLWEAIRACEKVQIANPANVIEEFYTEVQAKKNQLRKTFFGIEIAKEQGIIK